MKNGSTPLPAVVARVPTATATTRRRRQDRVLAATFGTACKSLYANRLRSMLTMLGIIIGVMAVIAAVTITQGTRSLITNTINSLGPNVIFISSGTAIYGGAFAAVGSDQSLTESDAKALTKVKHIANVSPLLNVNAQVIHGSKNWNTYVHGVYPNAQIILQWNLLKETGLATMTRHAAHPSL